MATWHGRLSCEQLRLLMIVGLRQAIFLLTSKSSVKSGTSSCMCLCARFRENVGDTLPYSHGLLTFGHLL